jgi:two-component system, cell cycle sensor histidine kinase and response regulator CckA
MGRSKRILVVDDEEGHRSLLEAMLESFGHQSVLATGGHEALDKLDSTIELVLLDVVMPDMDGFEVARQIRSRTECDGIPIVMLTAFSGERDRVKAISAGANEFITKPIDMTELQVRLASLLKVKDAQDALRRSERKYRTLVETAHDLVWTVDLDLRFTYVSPAVTRNLGYTVDEFMAMRPLDCLTPASCEKILQVYQEELALEAAGPRDRYASRTVEVERYHKDGSTRWAELAMTFLKDDSGKPFGIMGVSHDITERKQMEDALRKARDELEQRVEERTAELSRLNKHLTQEIADRKKAEEALRFTQRVVDHMSDSVFWARPDGSLAYVNDAACARLGYARTELLSLRVCDLVPHYTEDKWAAHWHELKQNRSLKFESRHREKTGEAFPVEIRTDYVQFEGQEYACGLARDITDRKKAEEALRESESRYRALFENSPDGILIAGVETKRFAYANPSVCRMLDYTTEELKALGVADIHPHDQLPRVMAEFEAQARGEKVLAPNIPCIRKDGTLFCADISTIAVVLDGRACNVGFFRDITERKRVEEALEKQVVQLNCFLNNIPDMAWLKDVNSNFIAANKAFGDAVGMAPEYLVNHTCEICFGEEAARKFKQDDESVMASRERTTIEESIIDANNNTIWLETIKSPTVDASGNVIGTVGIARNITERKRAEEALRDSEERFRAFSEATFEAIFLSEKGLGIDQNLAAEKMFGYSKEEILGQLGTGLISPEYTDLILKNMLSGYEEPYEAVALRKDGTTFPCEIQGKMCNYQGRPVRVTAIRDISSRKAAEQNLIRSEERFRTLVEKAPVAIAFSRNLKFVYVNPEFLRILGYTNVAELLGQPITDRISPQDLPRFEERARHREEGLTANSRYEAVAVRKDGSHFPFEAFATRLDLSDGEVTAAFFHDITERKQAEELRETLRNQIAQAQKMEAIGTLTGGIAHDFNNLLTIINGYTEMILSETTEDDPIYSDLQKVLETGCKGAEMVQRLLAFSKKAEVSLRPLDVNSIVENAIHLVGRTFPKIIEIETVLAKNLSLVNADAGQVEQVLMNLCINAKEAMPEGGRLKIETRNTVIDEHYCRLNAGARPGPFVLVEVTDSGSGMDAETKARMFDPFFTTKGWDSKKGNGLGLSVAKGIVEQHGGWITCESEPGKGTTFAVYFPVIRDSPVFRKPEPRAETVRGGEKILLVDDEEYVRDLGRRILERSGYTVLVASNGREALEIFAKERLNIGLVVLDLIMPHMGGDKCLEKLLKIDPHLKTVVSTGHSLTSKERERLGAHAKGFVSKPYQVKQFLEVVRELLDSE